MIGVLSAGGCSALTNTGGELVLRLDLAKDTYSTLGAEAVKLAAYPPFCKRVDPAIFERVKLLEEATARRWKVRT